MKQFLSIGTLLIALLLAVTACSSPATTGSSSSEVEPAAVVEQEEPAVAEAEEAEMAEEKAEEMAEETAEEMVEAETGPSPAEIAQMERAAAATIRDNERAGNREVEEGEVVDDEVRSLASFLPDLGEAPEINNGEPWINSEPLTLEDLEGKVVLIEFWTYS